MVHAELRKELISQLQMEKEADSKKLPRKFSQMGFIIFGAVVMILSSHI
jgi:hypothetical protein